MIGRELSLAARTLARSPILALTVTVTIAIGVGATTAIFSVANAVLLRPLPYTAPERLVVLYEDLRARNNLGMPFSNENFVDIREGTRDAFDDMAVVQTQRQVFPGADGRPEQVKVAGVTTNFLQMMGASIALGRDFSPADGVPAAQAPPPGSVPAAGPPQQPPPTMVILSHDYWQRRFGGKSDVLGQRIVAGGRQGLEIVGVLSPGFELLFPPADGVERRPDMWIAQRFNYNNANRNGYGLRPVGRLKTGVTVATAQDQVERVEATIRRDFPIYGSSNSYARVEPMARNLVAGVRPALITLMGAGFFLLLIACANVANLLVVRASRRQAELAVRAAMGADAWQLVRPMLAEVFILGVLGSAGGALLAWMGVRALLQAAPANLPRLDAVAMDGWALAYATVAGMAAAVLFGLAPVASAFRIKAIDVLRGSGRSEGLGPGGRIRSAVVALEVALCFVLLVGSGLMVRSFLALQRIDPGFDSRHMLTFQLLGGRFGPPEQRLAITNDLKAALSAVPGVTGVTASFPFPLAGDFSTIRWGTEEALADNSKYQAVDWQRVLPGYFETIGTRLIEGRTFTDADNLSRQPLVVVDEVLAAKAFPQQSAVGKRILVRIRTPEPEWVEIIGVVAHQRVTSLSEPGREEVFFTDGFLGFGGARKWALRVNGAAGDIGSAVRTAVEHVDPGFLIVETATFDELVQRSTAGTRFQLLLVSVFAIVAAILVAVGLYGVLSTMVRQRTMEIGVRMALGATPSSVRGLVVRHGLKLSAIGMVLGLAAAVGLTQAMGSMLVGVAPTDPLTYAVMVLAFLVLAAVSAWLPALRASRLDPTRALRGE